MSPIPFSPNKLNFSTIEQFGSYGTIKVSNKQQDVTDNISTIQKNISGVDSSYDAIDSTGALRFNYDSNNPSPHIQDAIIHDINSVLIQQNMLNIIASITAATLIIAAIVISRNK